MLGLITDRSQSNVDRRNALSAKGWNAMSDAEKAEWTGDIFTPELAGYTDPVNVLPNNNYYSGQVSIKFRNNSITASALTSGIYSYAVIIIGDAANFVNKTLTLSVGGIYTSGAGTPLLALYWHDANGFEAVGAGLSQAGSITFNAGENTGNRESLALYVYATTDTTVAVGDYILYEGVMLEFGDTRHGYVPYTEALPTNARKGAYNYSDLNRVERAVAELAEDMSLPLVTKTNWTQWDVPTRADMDRFLGNISAIRGAGVGFATTPLVPGDMAKLTYTMANEIEKILLDIKSAASSVVRSGEVYCGEV